MYNEIYKFGFCGGEHIIIGFIMCSIVAAVFLGIGFRCCKSKEAVGFFTFMKPPIVEDIEHYNKAVSVLWFVVAAALEIFSIPFLFLKQNSPLFFPVIFAVVGLLIIIMIVYSKIEGKYKKF